MPSSLHRQRGSPWSIVFSWVALVATAHAGEGLHWFGENALRVHLMFNHLPIFGTVLGVFALALAFLWKNDVSRRVALVLLLVSTAAAYPVFQAGEDAADDARMIADDPGSKWIDVHMERAERGIYVFYVAAFVTAVALYAEARHRRWATPATIAAGILGAAACAGSIWIADAGGKIRHSELRAVSHEKGM